jgi:hypothetical protein
MVGRLFPLALVFLAVGISTALFHPFLALFLSTEVEAGPVRVTAFLIAAPLAGVIAAAGGFRYVYGTAAASARRCAWADCWY